MRSETKTVHSSYTRDLYNPFYYFSCCCTLRLCFHWDYVFIELSHNGPQFLSWLVTIDLDSSWVWVKSVVFATWCHPPIYTYPSWGDSFETILDFYFSEYTDVIYKIWPFHCSSLTQYYLLTKLCHNCHNTVPYTFLLWEVIIDYCLTRYSPIRKTCPVKQ